MRLKTSVIPFLAIAALSEAGAQASTRPVIVRSPAAPYALSFDQPRAVIGVQTSTSTGVRDTLGLLVSAVTRNSPAEKAGIEEGNRIASINGINLRLAAADIGDPDMERLMSRRLSRELDKVKPGDEVELRVYGGGQTRTMKVKTVEPEALYEETRVGSRRKMEERASLGIGLGSGGSRRDTLGVFVMSVDEDGPAAKAGIEEGHRISAINGVDLRVSRDDAGDDMVSWTKLNRLERELSKLKPGDAVELRVLANGQTRTVKITTVAASSLKSGNSFRIFRHGGAGMTIHPPLGIRDLEIDGEAIGASVRRAIERAQTVTGERLEDLGQLLDNIGRGMNGGGGTIRWLEEGGAPRAKPVQPAPAKKAAPVGRTVISM